MRKSIATIGTTIGTAISTAIAIAFSLTIGIQSVKGQVPPPPDCVVSFQTTVTTSGGNTFNFPNNATGFDNRTAGCVTWLTQYQNTSGFVTSVAIQSALGAVTPATFGAYTGTTLFSSTGFGASSTAGTNCCIATYSNIVTGTVVSTPWMRVHVVTSGAGSVAGVLYGYKAGYSAKSGGGGGGNGTVTNVAGGCSLAGGPITTTGTLSQAEPVNKQTGTTYTVVAGDCGKLVTQSNAAAVAYTLPVASTTGFGMGYYVDVQNTGAGTVTITPTTSTIDGASSLALTTNQGVRIASDGSNYFTQRGVGGSSGGSGVTNVGSGCSLAGGPITTTGTLLQATPVNAQTGTTYTFVAGDCGKLVSQSNASAIADTLPVASTSGFGAGFFTKVENTGAGVVTITPTTSTIDGNATVVLNSNQGVEIASDGTNYYTVRGIGAGSGSPTSPAITCPHNAVCSGILLKDTNSNYWGPIYPVTLPPLASSWTQVGRASSTLQNIPGGGLTYTSGFTGTIPAGYQVAIAGPPTTPFSPWTFSVAIDYSTATAGTMGIFCSDNAGNAVLWNWGLNVTTVNYWSGMTNGGSPSIQLGHTAVPLPIMPRFVRIRVDTGAGRNFEYSTDGQIWTAYTNDVSNTWATCVNAGIQGWGDGSQFSSIGTVVSVLNTTP